MKGEGSFAFFRPGYRTPRSWQSRRPRFPSFQATTLTLILPTQNFFGFQNPGSTAAWQGLRGGRLKVTPQLRELTPDPSVRLQQCVEQPRGCCLVLSGWRADTYSHVPSLCMPSGTIKAWYGEKKVACRQCIGYCGTVREDLLVSDG